MNDRRTCPHPACDVTIPADVYACRAHWYSLPMALRRTVNLAYHRWRRRPTPELTHALDDAQTRAAAWWQQ